MNRTPYMRGIIDGAIAPGVEEIVFIAGTQVGKTTAEENLLGYWIDNDPGPCLIVKPTESDVGEYIKERVRPLLEHSLASHVSPEAHDNTLRAIKLDTMPVYFGWAGSPGSLASRPCRYVLLDECDKFPPFAGREADPVSLAKERTATYLHRKRVMLTSTPTTREGTIWRAWETAGDRRYYFVPCPHCGEMQRLVWSQVKWPKLAEPDKVKRGDEIENSRLAWYECNACKDRIEESHKPKMLERGEWRSENGEACRPAKRVGFHLSSLYSPWRTFAAMAAEFIRAEGDIAATMNFRNSRLAEPFESQISVTESSVIRDKAAAGHAEGIVPKEAVAIFATADVQKDHLWYVVRAWGYGFRSWLMRYGTVANFMELQQAIFGTPLAAEGGAHVSVGMLGIDDQYRQPEVQEFAKSMGGRVLRLHGLSTFAGPMLSTSRYDNGVEVVNVNTLLSKDRLNQIVNDGDPARWSVFTGVGEDYVRQQASEHKIFDRVQKAELWKQKTAGNDNHLWDCEAMQVVLATKMHLDIPAPMMEAAGEPAVQEVATANPFAPKRRY